MRRNRVLSFMTQWGGQPRSPGPDDEPVKHSSPASNANQENVPPKNAVDTDIIQVAPAGGFKADEYAQKSMQSTTTPSRARGDSRVSARPLSMMQTYNPPQVEVAPDTPPELQPIFTFLNSHSNKLYQEGYFLKLHDLDSRGRPSQDRVWNECFAQLVGTVLSLWDAAALDAAGEDGEVMPTFINLSDATIKMIESLPMNSAQGGNLQNVLSISTAANNRYLLHFNSLNSLTQWTAGIRLSIFEHSTLHEAYTGSLIAGKGKYLNNIKQIMERSKFAYEDWARVRFGAGTPWRRYWCVISPPDEKEYQKAAKVLRKSSSYARPTLPKGDIKFYDTRKITKKTKPVASISDAYAAYAIYPQSKPLIDQSTLVKLEGLVTMHTSPETTTEGFVFVMPEAHAAVSGFEMMLRWLFPVFDTFCLYGRPNRLIADTLDQRGLMFAMPQDRRYGYLDTLDVSGLIHTSGSQSWTERQWRKEMKKLTAQRVTAHVEGSPRNSRQISVRRNTSGRTSLPPPQRNSIRFDEAAPIHSSPGSRSASPVHGPGAEIRMTPPRRTDSAPPQSFSMSPHKRSVSDAQGYRKYMSDTPSRLSHEASRPDDFDAPPAPPAHGGVLGAVADLATPPPFDRLVSDDDLAYNQVAQTARSPNVPPPEPVTTPPAFTHTPNSRPPVPLIQAPELRRAHSNVDADTLHQMQDAQRGYDPAGEGYGSDDPTTPEHAYQDAYAYRQPGMHLQDFDARTARDPRQRLSTIPGSPYVDAEGEFMDTPRKVAMPQMDAVVEDHQAWAAAGGDPADRRSPPVPLHSSQSIARKPIPKKLPQVPSGEDADPSESARAAQVRADELSSPTSPISPVGSFEGAIIDQEALERILNQDNDRNTTMLSHVSSATPDYASTASVSSHGDKKPVDKPRAGRLKTVGVPGLPDPKSGGAGRLDTYYKDKAEEAAQIPSIDFGPTYAYKPDSRPGTSGTMTPTDLLNDRRARSRSADRLRAASGERLGSSGPSPKISPGESNRHSYFGGRATPTGIERSDSPSQRNSIAWTPSGQSPGGTHQSRPSLTPEQWVQYRASLAAQPQLAPRISVPTYAHQRQNSSQSDHQLRQSMTRTPPPFARSPSADWTQQGQQTPPSRPNSRGAGVYLNHSPGGLAMSSTALTAKEQMHVARATGSPLINMPSGTRKPQDEPSPGLVGALAAREREKAAFKEGVRSSAVQQAILSRQQQQAQLEAEAFAQAQAHFQAQAQQETQRQLAYQQALMQQQQSQGYLQQPQPLQPAQVQQARMSWGPNRLSTGSPSQLQMQQGYNTPPSRQYSPGPGSMYTQQQPQQHSRPVSMVSLPLQGQQQGYYTQSPQQQQGQQQGYFPQAQQQGQQGYYAQAPQQPGQWQQPRR